MQTRRTVLSGLTGSVMLCNSAAWGQQTEDLPKPKLVPGKPPQLDFGGGVLVPCNKHALLTLWEGDTFWMTIGFGTASNTERAKAEAAHRASGTMKYLLLTLAFAPNRLEKTEGSGWHQKVESPANYVIGDLDIPGKDGVPLTDAFRGFGNADQSNLGGIMVSGGIGPGSSLPGTTSGTNGFNAAAMLNKVHAFSTYFVRKADLDLDAVRKRAKAVAL